MYTDMYTIKQGVGRFTGGGGLCVLRNCDGSCTDFRRAVLKKMRLGRELITQKLAARFLEQPPSLSITESLRKEHLNLAYYGLIRRCDPLSDPNLQGRWIRAI